MHPARFVITNHRIIKPTQKNSPFGSEGDFVADHSPFLVLRRFKVIYNIIIYNMSRTLILKTSDILASNDANDYFNKVVSNANGVIENNRYSFTWNINLREKLGDSFYNSYSRFSIQMKAYADCPFMATTIIDPLDTYMQGYARLCIFSLSGLNYDPMPYMNGVSTNGAVVHFAGVNGFPSVAGTATGSTQVSDRDGPVFYFTKPTQDTVSLRIDITLTYNNQMYQPPTSAQLFGHRIFGFRIVGIV
jgi:hypothetical protein